MTQGDRSDARQTAGNSSEGRTGNPIYLHDSALAKAFVDRDCGRARYVADKRKWLVRDCAIWKPDKRRIAENMVRQFLDEVNTEGDTRLGSDRTIKGVLNQVSNDQRVALTSDMLDRDDHLIGTPAGILDLRVGEYRHLDLDPLITKTTSVAPDFIGPRKEWMGFLDEFTMGNVSLIRYLQVWCGYCLTGEVGEHAMLVLYGLGRNGKSTFIEVLSDILHEYARVPDRDLFTSGGRPPHFSSMAHLIGSRLAALPETDRGAKWNESVLKAFTGGDKMNAKGMYVDQEDFKPKAKLVVGTNHLPEPQSVTKAMRERLQIVEIEFSTNTPDTTLKSRLELEYPAILAWMVQGAVRYYRRRQKVGKGIKVPQGISEANSAYFDQFDFFKQWWEMCVDETGKSAQSTTAQIAQSFNDYLLSQGEQPWTTRDIGYEVTKRGYKSKPIRFGGKMTRVYRGVKVLRSPGSKR